LQVYYNTIWLHRNRIRIHITPPSLQLYPFHTDCITIAGNRNPGTDVTSAALPIQRRWIHHHHSPNSRAIRRPLMYTDFIIILCIHNRYYIVNYYTIIVIAVINRVWEVRLGRRLPFFTRRRRRVCNSEINRLSNRRHKRLVRVKSRPYEKCSKQSRIRLCSPVFISAGQPLRNR